MFDTIGINLPRNTTRDVSLRRLESKVDFDKESKNIKTGITWISGNYKNFHISINSQRLLLNGSLAKFYLNNNVQTLTPLNVEDALTQLQNELSVPILRGTINRIDIADTFFVNDPLLYYFKSLKETPPYERQRHDRSVRYGKGNLVLTFYDKNDDVVHTPEVFHANRDKHALRIELRIMCRVRRTMLFDGQIIGACLYSRLFQKKLAELWFKHYNAILKERILLPQMEISNWKDYRDFLAMIGIRELSITRVFDEIDMISQSKSWSPEKKSLMRRYCKDLVNDCSYTHANEHIKELEMLINDSVISQYLHL